MIVSTITHIWKRTIIHCHQLSPTIMQFGHVQIRHDCVFRLTKRMIVHDSFSVSGGNQEGLNAIWLLHCHCPVKNNKAIIWTYVRTTVTLKARKWEKRKNLIYLVMWSGVVVEMQPNRWVQGLTMLVDDYHIAVTKIVAIASNRPTEALALVISFTFVVYRYYKHS